MSTEQTPCIRSELRRGCLVVTILEPQMRNFEKVTRIKTEIIAAVHEFVPKTIVLDLSFVNFVGSIGFLIFMAIRREPNVETVVLCHLDENVHKLFAICKLIPDGSNAPAPLQLAETVEQAIALYGE